MVGVKEGMTALRSVIPARVYAELKGDTGTLGAQDSEHPTLSQCKLTAGVSAARDLAGRTQWPHRKTKGLR